MERMLLTALALAVTSIALPARADTLGLLPCTSQGNDVTVGKPVGGPRVVVARDAAAWRAEWKAAGGDGSARMASFDQFIVVGVVNGAGDDRVIYRIQLDSAEAPTALEVHIARGGAPCGPTERTRATAGAQFVWTARSSLPVHFVFDEMVDGRIYVADPATEGVGRVDVGTVAAAAAATPAHAAGATAKAFDREVAEHAVFAVLTAAEKAALAKGPLGRTLPRIPHGWTKLAVFRDPDKWVIAYDELVFHVDVATGKVTRR